jgi:hypothetical protein
MHDYYIELFFLVVPYPRTDQDILAEPCVTSAPHIKNDRVKFCEYQPCTLQFSMKIGKLRKALKNNVKGVKKVLENAYFLS